MFKTQFYKSGVIIAFLWLLGACSSISTTNNEQPVYSQAVNERNAQMLALTDWQLKGKIAFLQGKQKESANINWRYSGSNNNQRLDLTTYLGINVLHLNSANEQNTIKVDGKSYQSKNLDQLIFSLTGYVLPTKALTFWLKGLPYSNQDIVSYEPQSQLPSTLISQYDNQQWQVIYNKYKNIDGYQLPTSITIKQNNLTIKVAIHQWLTNR
ncbi:lipoprotein insertase outer membrane protein LolB [Thalassotalea sp. PLHSN55]|uniref:lipoprotein insertase outer membrane protein LolB n=1 Tax=Thalassotalea sp. PLHSN55 TaxID=3435888 RepID=UPI003F8578D3